MQPFIGVGLAPMTQSLPGMSTRSYPITSLRRRKSVEPPTWTPADLPSLALWLETRLGVYQDTGTATPAVNVSDPVGNLPDGSANAYDRIQATGGNRPVLAAWSGGLGGKALSFPGGVGSKALTGTSVATTGAFTLFATGSRVANTDLWAPCGKASGAGGVFGYTDGNLYLQTDGFTSRSHAFGVTGDFVLVVVRTAALDIYFAWTGQAELAITGLAGNVPFTSIGNQGGEMAGGLHRTTLLSLADLRGTSDYTNALAYLAAKDGPTL